MMSERKEIELKTALLNFLKSKFQFAGSEQQAKDLSFSVTDELFLLIVHFKDNGLL